MTLCQMGSLIPEKRKFGIKFELSAKHAIAFDLQKDDMIYQGAVISDAVF